MFIHELSPEELVEGIKANKVLLVDVREPTEYSMERIPGAVLVPFSSFDPAALPNPSDRSLVFLCASGVRSRKAAEWAQSAGLACNTHLAGGLKAWKDAGFPIEQ